MPSGLPRGGGDCSVMSMDLTVGDLDGIAVKWWDLRFGDMNGIAVK